MLTRPRNLSTLVVLINAVTKVNLIRNYIIITVVGTFAVDLQSIRFLFVLRHYVVQ